jgi:uncharacterized glyoxalase superfamily protein PhnB
MKLGYTIIYVADVAATIEFYERAFGLQRTFVHESGMYGELATGDTVLAFAAEPMAAANGLSIRPNRPTEAPAGFEIALVTADPIGAYATALAAGAVPVSAPAAKPWGQLVGYVRDCNGCAVEICAPMGG